MNGPSSAIRVRSGARGAQGAQAFRCHGRSALAGMEALPRICCEASVAQQEQRGADTAMLPWGGGGGGWGGGASLLAVGRE